MSIANSTFCRLGFSNKNLVGNENAFNLGGGAGGDSNKKHLMIHECQCYFWHACLREGTPKMVFSQKTKIRIAVNMSIFKRYRNG